MSGANEQVDPAANEPADDASGGFDGSVLLPCLAWPIVHAQGTPDGLLWSLLVGVGGGVLMFLGSAMLTGMMRSGRHTETVSWTVVVLLTSIYWWGHYPWWGALVLLAVGLYGSFTLWRGGRGRASLNRSLPLAVEEALAELPATVPDAYRDVIKVATDRFLTIRRYAEGELASLEALRPQALVQAAEGTLVGVVAQVRRLVDMGESAALSEAVRAGKRRLDAKLRSLDETRDQVLILAQETSAGGEHLSDKVDTLRLTVASLREINALEADED